MKEVLVKRNLGFLNIENYFKPIKHRIYRSTSQAIYILLGTQKKMVEEQDNQSQYFLADFNTRLQDLEGKTSTIKDRTIMLGENLISLKEKIDEEISEVKKTLKSLEKKMEKVDALTKALASETNSFVKRDEMVLIERMLKDFQPLEFMRKKDVEELIEQKINKGEKTTI